MKIVPAGRIINQPIKKDEKEIYTKKDIERIHNRIAKELEEFFTPRQELEKGSKKIYIRKQKEHSK